MSYPAFCKTDEDKKIYRKVRSKGWTKWVHNASDILAIKNGCWFDVEEAQRFENFCRLLRLSKGDWADQPLELQPWQRDDFCYPLFGWKRPDGTRRFRKGLAFIPKKASKSTLAAAISLYLLLADREKGAEVYTLASDRDQ